jgi:hypothetical protein
MSTNKNLSDDQDHVKSFGHLVPRCTARMKKNGLRCTLPAVSGYTVCRMHGANPKNKGGGKAGNLNSMTHGAYVKRLLDDRDRELFDEMLEAIRRDFDLNDSTDQIQASMASFYYTRWIRAVEGNADAAIANFDILMRKQLESLKMMRVQRDTPDGPQTTPAEWAVALLERVREAGKNATPYEYVEPEENNLNE